MTKKPAAKTKKNNTKTDAHLMTASIVAAAFSLVGVVLFLVVLFR